MSKPSHCNREMPAFLRNRAANPECSPKMAHLRSPVLVGPRLSLGEELRPADAISRFFTQN